MLSMKSCCNWGVYAYQLRRFRWFLPGFFLISFFLLTAPIFSLQPKDYRLPTPESSESGMSAPGMGEPGIIVPEGYDAPYQKPRLDDAVIERVTQSRTTLAGLAVLGCACAAVAVFAYKFGTKGTMFFHSLPMRRGALFALNACAAFTLVLAPFLAAWALTWLTVALRGFLFAGVAGALWSLLWLGLLEFSVFFAIALFSIVLSGNVIAYLVFYGGFNVAYYIFDGLIVNFLQRAMYGIKFLGIREHTLSPFVYLSNRVQVIPAGVVWLYIGLTLALLAASFLLYRRQNTETAGDFLAARSLRHCFKVLAAATAALCGNYIMQSLRPGYLYNPLPVTAYFLLFGCAGFALADMLLKKTFRVFCRALAVRLGICAAVVAVVACFVFADPLRITQLVPDEEDVAAVYVDNFGQQQGMYLLAMENQKGMRYNWAMTEEYKALYERGASGELFNNADGEITLAARNVLPGVLQQKENIRKAIALHRYLLSQEAEIRQDALQRSVYITYALNDGRVIRRQYWYGQMADYSPLTDVLNAPEYVYKRFAVDLPVTVNLSEIGRAVVVDGMTQEQLWYSPKDDDARSLYAAVIEDVKAGSIGQSYATKAEAMADVYYVRMSFYFPGVITHPALQTYDHCAVFDIMLTRRAEHTLQWFKTHGMLDEALPELDASRFGYRPFDPADIGNGRLSMF